MNGHVGVVCNYHMQKWIKVSCSQSIEDVHHRQVRAIAHKNYNFIGNKPANRRGTLCMR